MMVEALKTIVNFHCLTDSNVSRACLYVCATFAVGVPQPDLIFSCYFNLKNSRKHNLNLN